jgi:hypothetical protein
VKLTVQSSQLLALIEHVRELLFVELAAAARACQFAELIFQPP